MEKPGAQENGSGVQVGRRGTRLGKDLMELQKPRLVLLLGQFLSWRQ